MRSVRAQLLVGLILGLGAMSALAGYGIFRSALEEANELFDYELRSVAISLPQSVADTELANKESGDFEGLQDDRVVIQIWDASGLLTYESIPGARLPRQHTGFQSVEAGGRHYRVFGLQQASRFVQVGQPLSVRDESALTQASRTLWPLLAIVPLEIALVLLVVKRALRPVTIISRSLAARSIETLAPLDMANAIPTEIEPLVEALNDLLLRLDRALRAQRVFVADAAHELRTPLTALKLQIQVARRDHATLSDEDLLRSKRLGAAVRPWDLIGCIVVPTKFFSGNQCGRDVGRQTREVEQTTELRGRVQASAGRANIRARRVGIAGCPT